MSMAYSLETRAPLLDYCIVKLLYQVDKKLKVPTFRHKGVKHKLNNIMANKLPAEIINRKKQGFEVPLRKWSKEDEFDNILNPNFSSTELNTNMIDSLITENKRAQFDHETLIW